MNISVKAGRQEFFRWLGEKDTDFSREMKSSFLMKAFFSGNFGNGFMELCITWAKRCIARLEALV